MKAFQHKNATSVKEAVALLAQGAGKALPIAGGSDLLGEMKDLVNQVAHKFQGSSRTSPFSRDPKSPHP